MYTELLTRLESLRESLEGLPEATGDAEALLRIQVAESLASAAQVLRALANDESEERR